jgi:hypothetical protein
VAAWHQKKNKTTIGRKNKNKILVFESKFQGGISISMPPNRKKTSLHPFLLIAVIDIVMAPRHSA